MAFFSPVRVAELARQLGLKPAQLRKLGRALGIRPRAEPSLRQEYEAVHAKMLFLAVCLIRQGESVAFAAFLRPELYLTAERMVRDPGVRVVISPDEPPRDLEGRAVPDLVLERREVTLFLGDQRRKFQRAIREALLASG